MSGSNFSSILGASAAAAFSCLYSSCLETLEVTPPPTTLLQEAVLLLREGTEQALERLTLVGFTQSACGTHTTPEA